MQLSTVSACKVIATLGLGTIAAFHTQLAATTLSALHNQTRREQIARDALNPLHRIHLLAGASVSLSTLVWIAYAASSQKGRHPYLNYVAGSSLIAAATSFLGTGKILRVLAGQTLALDALLDQVKTKVLHGLGRRTTEIDLEKGQATPVGELNGEVVDAALTRAERLAWTTAGLSIVSFLMSLAGNLGDRY
ncbi:hypothetical protein BCR37DRAFT_280694 [Protomyces lactucae-debilis]|uniref:Uncharacterized protein n=1 Tax=Protomyces lactucae-debilis TaxID=2754530 RepID=A0A1Y2FJP7_PROLT|nr:uncharacterized protein BCR37DRAFT_280694 [Protomyces lactucae-debilis]ORY83817.1 hypothetical protein BCR37DRAFT_280694 [Protomyces lactucae-debilis]